MGIFVLGKKFMGKKHHENPHIRGLKKATAGILLVRNRRNGRIIHGIGILYPDENHFFFSPAGMSSTKKLWQAMYAASKLLHVSNDAITFAMAVADESILADDSRFMREHHYMPYGYDVARLRRKTLVQKVPKKDAVRIMIGLVVARVITPFSVLWAKIEGWKVRLFPS